MAYATGPGLCSSKNQKKKQYISLKNQTQECHNPSPFGATMFFMQGTAATLRFRGGATGARGAMPATAPDITSLPLPLKVSR